MEEVGISKGGLVLHFICFKKGSIPAQSWTAGNWVKHKQRQVDSGLLLVGIRIQEGSAQN